MFDDNTTTAISVSTFEPPTRQLAEHQLIDRRLRAYAGQRAALDAAESADLVRAYELRLHCMHGCSTFLEYMERRLGYTPHTARERLRVARALVSLPASAAALTTGALTYTHVRELSRVVTPETEDAWLAAIAGKISFEVQELVAAHAYGDLPTDPPRPNLKPVAIRLELPTEVFALWREVRKVLSDEINADASDAQVMEAVCRQFLDPQNGATRPAHQIGYVQCPTCKAATVNGAGRAIDVRPAVIERAACDARILGDLEVYPQRSTTTVTARMREQVLARDGYRCCVPGCRSTRNLDVHHLWPQALGGPHKMWNLTGVCGGHHAATHEGLLSITGRAPGQLTIFWTYGPPLRADATPEERDVQLRAATALVFGGPLIPDDPPDVPAGTSRRKRGRS
jgi:hypothetical protein